MSFKFFKDYYISYIVQFFLNKLKYGFEKEIETGFYYNH